jgi:hypothetical protein
MPLSVLAAHSEAFELDLVTWTSLTEEKTPVSAILSDEG